MLHARDTRVLLLAGLLLALPPALRAQQSSSNLQPTHGSSVRGTIQLEATEGGVHFTGTVTGLTPGEHGFHIHENGDCSAPDGSSAGGHFDPSRRRHGTPEDDERHAGDLGNIVAGRDGSATVDIHAEGITLGTGASSILGKSIIVHSGPDDFSQPAGSSGNRLACGVIK